MLLRDYIVYFWFSIWFVFIARNGILLEDDYITYVTRLTITYFILIAQIIFYFKVNRRIRYFDIVSKLIEFPNTFILGYIAITIVSTSISPYLDLQNFIQLQRISANFIQIVLFIIASIVARLTLSESDFIRFFSSGIIAGTIASLAGLALTLESWPGRLGHSTYNPVYVGVWSCFSSLLLLSGDILRRGTLLWIMILFFMIVTFLAFSKAAFIALLITVIFLSIWSRSWWSINYLLSASLCALLFTWPLLFDNVERYVTSGNLENLTKRTWIWKWTWDMILERPLIGYGYKIFQDVMKIHEGYNIPHAHNLILDVIFTSGFVGAAIYFVWLLSSFLSALKSKNLFIIPIFIFFAIRSVVEPRLNLLEDFIVIFPLTLLNRHRTMLAVLHRVQDIFR